MNQKARILYVEDTMQNRLLVRRLVEARGWAYLEAENGEQALRLLAAEHRLPDVILMDLAMPVMDGYETTRRIKADPRLQAVPVLALTAHAMPGDQERAEAAGCDMYFTKPIDTGGLLDVLQGVLDSRATSADSGIVARIHRNLSQVAMCEGSHSEDLKPCIEAIKALLRQGEPEDSQRIPGNASRVP